MTQNVNFSIWPVQYLACQNTQIRYKVTLIVSRVHMVYVGRDWSICAINRLCCAIDRSRPTYTNRRNPCTKCWPIFLEGGQYEVWQSESVVLPVRRTKDRPVTVHGIMNSNPVTACRHIIFYRQLGGMSLVASKLPVKDKMPILNVEPSWRLPRTGWLCAMPSALNSYLTTGPRLVTLTRVSGSNPTWVMPAVTFFTKLGESTSIQCLHIKASLKSWLAKSSGLVLCLKKFDFQKSQSDKSLQILSSNDEDCPLNTNEISSLKLL